MEYEKGKKGNVAFQKGLFGMILAHTFGKSSFFSIKIAYPDISNRLFH